MKPFFRNSKPLFKRRSYSGLITECLSIELQRNVRNLIAYNVFQGVWWLRECEENLTDMISEKFKYMLGTRSLKSFNDFPRFLQVHGILKLMSEQINIKRNFTEVIPHISPVFLLPSSLRARANTHISTLDFTKLTRVS